MPPNTFNSLPWHKSESDRTGRTKMPSRRMVNYARHKYSLAVALGLLASIFVTSPASTDVPLELVTGMRIENPAATPGPAGGVSILRFRIVNEDSAREHLVGLSTPVAGAATLHAALGDDRYTTLGSIGVAGTETLDFATSHLRYEISPLARTLSVGDEFPVEFEFMKGRVVVLFHVHEAHLF